MVRVCSLIATQLRLLLASTALVALTPAVAIAATQTARDPHTGARFVLNGADLLVSFPAPGSMGSDRGSMAALKDVQGKQVTVLCAERFYPRVVGRVSAKATWPSTATSMHFPLPGDVSGRASACLLEESDGGDVATVSFGGGLELSETERYTAGSHGYRGKTSVRDARGRIVARNLEGGVFYPFLPGRYTVTAFQRPCGKRSCHGAALPRCRKGIRLRANALVRLTVEVNVRRGCAIKRNRY